MADLTEDMAAEQKARAAYERLLTLTDDPQLKDGIRFQHFGEALDNVQGFMNSKKIS